jgi:hypothetical protein
MHHIDLTILSAIRPPTEAKMMYGTEMVRNSSPVWLGVKPNLIWEGEFILLKDYTICHA